MDPKVVYWTFAFANMGVVVALALRAMVAIRDGQPETHRKWMRGATWLVIGFVVSYVFKLLFLGREDLSLWSQRDLNILRFHETCVLVMVVAGGVALARALRVRHTRRVTLDPGSPETPESALRWHRRAGWSALVASVLGVLSAAVVLQGMFARL